MGKPFPCYRLVVDTTAPTLQSAVIASSGTTLTLTFDEAVIVTTNGYTFTPSGGSAALTLFSGSGTSTIVFSINRTIYDDETATIAYSSVTGDTTDLNSNTLVTFGATGVTNSSTQEPPESPEVSIIGAVINSAGTAITVDLSGDATITDATGWSVTFDNNASRTLSYVSGSGGDTFIFEFEAVSPSTDGRAPVGTVCLLSYDADTGNVVDMADVTDNAVTNNSTQIPDPDLPRNLPTAELPANWNATADHTPADGTALQALLNDFGGTLNARDVIDLDADVDYGHIRIPSNVQGDASNWIIIRSDEYASLPTFDLDDSSGRVTEADETYMATISRTPSQGGHKALNIDGGLSGVGAGYIRFIGIKFMHHGSMASDVLTIVSTLTTGDAGSSLAGHHPHHIVIDRCAFTHANTMKGVQDALRFDCEDSAIVGCNFYNLWGAGNDGSNATRVYNGNRILIRNNRFHCNGGSGFVGDNWLTTVHDYEFSRNYHFRDSDWGTGHGNNKASLETKTGLRINIYENVFDYQFGAGSFGAITIKAEGTGGPKTTKHVTIRGNSIDHCFQGFTLLVGGSSDDADVGPNSDFLVIDNISVNPSFAGWAMNVYDSNSSGALKRVQMIRNTIEGSSRLYQNESGLTPGQYFVYRDNIMFAATYVFYMNAVGGDALGLNYGFGTTYSVTHNLLVGKNINNFDSDTTPTPLGVLTNNQFPANEAAVGFTDFSGDDYAISESSAYKNSSSTGGKPGYDSTTYDAIWAEVAN